MTTVVALKEQERAGKAGAPTRRPSSGRRTVMVGAAVAVLALSAYSDASASGQTRSGGGGAGAPLLPTPLATSVQAGGGTWATVAMGDLGQPLDTFWQLLFRPSRASSWSDRVEATAVATNGGLVLASGSNSLVVGVRPSNNLTFSPLISTSDGGRSWSNGLLNQGLVSRPQALASGPDGSALAIVQGGEGAQVVRDTKDLSAWQPVTTVRALASTPSSRACGPSAITSVGYLSGQAVIGTNCDRGGKAGIFMEREGTWRLAGPPLGSRQERAQVLGLLPSNVGLTALLELASATGSSGSTTSGFERTLVAAWANAKGTWRTSAPLVLGRGDRLVSFGATPTSGVFALIAAPDGRKELVAAAGLGPGAKGEAGAGWRHLPAPPQTTATVAYLPGGTVDALAVSKTVLTVWALAPSSASLSAKWVKGQVLDVPVQFGSSS